MNSSSQRVLKYLAGNENIDNVSIDELQKLADENPYFPVARLLLVKKLKSAKQEHFLPQVQKTALYFSNPYWLHYQLSDDLWQTITAEENSVIEKTESADKPDRTQLAANEEPCETSGISSEAEIELSNIIYSKSGTNLSEEKTENVSQPEEEMAAVTRDTDATTDEFLNEAVTGDKTFIPDTLVQVVLETQTPAEQEATEVLEEMAGVTRDTDETTEVFLDEASTTTEENSEQNLLTAIPPFTSELSADKKIVETAEPDEHERMFQNIKAMLDATSEEAEADVENAIIPIDPYYTIDYFASQGIKLELEQNPQDQLGQHLKKFTQWLKHMKKLGPEDATEVITRTDSEADIQKIAESSNTVREVVTEAMASVLEKQGKNDKAAELYKKLSFLNPEKSAYFAGKIKNLKGI